MKANHKTWRVAHILPWPGVGGVELATLRVAQAVEQYGFHSVAFCLSSAQPTIDFFTRSGLETATWEPELPDLRHLRGFIYRSLQLSRELTRREIDIVHCSDLPAGGYTALAGRLAGLPVICHIRNRFTSRLPGLQAGILKTVDRFAFVSRDTWRRFPHRVSPRRGVVVYDGIEAGTDEPHARAEHSRSVREEFGIPDAAKIVGMVARVDQQKDYLTLAKAAARVVAQQPNVRFLIVGSHSIEPIHREHYEKVKQMLSECGVTDQFIFTDFRRDVNRLMQAMDVFVLSTHYEGLPLVVLEAMALGAPVIATAVDGIPEVVTHHETGLLFPHADDEQLAAHIQALLSDPDQAAALGAAARRFISEHFNQGQFTSSLVSLYCDVLGIDRIEPTQDQIAAGLNLPDFNAPFNSALKKTSSLHRAQQ